MIEGIDISIKKSKRKTLSIYIERDGSVSVLAPESISDKEIEETVKKKEYQIFKNLADQEELNRSRVNREIVNGQSYLYLGRNYRLKIENSTSESLILKNGYFILKMSEKENAFDHFKSFYKRKGLPRIKERVEYFRKKMGVQPNKVVVMELKNRWASCTKQGNLNFHWKSVMAPLSVLDYIIVHELAHLIHMNHTKAFWNEVDKVIPDYRKREEWLKRNGASMDL